MAISPIAARMHDAALEYVAPKMSRAARINFAHAFDGVDAANFRQRLPQIVGTIVGRTADSLAFDASVEELTQRMEQAAIGPTGVAPQAGGGAAPRHFTTTQIEQVVDLLRPHVDPATLDELRKILGYEEALDRQNATGMGEDSRYRGINGQLARARIERRLGVALPKPEPVYAPAPPPRVSNASAVADFYRRFPEARDIKHA